MEDHLDFIECGGVTRWVLRECVRANPLYVISAAFLSYGVLQLNTEIDPQIGKAGGIVLSLALLHVYEIAVLLAATCVLKRRGGGGGDLHGLMIVAALFMGGSFLALDELIAIKPWLGLVLVPGALLLAHFKLDWYAGLPGIRFPAAYRRVALIVIGAHALAPLMGAPAARLAIGYDAAHGLAWLPGWVSLASLLWLAKRDAQPVAANEGELDPLISRRCGAWGIALIVMTSFAHLFAADWVFDRPFDTARALPELLMLCAALLLLRWPSAPRLDFWNSVVVAAPMLAVQWGWAERSPWYVEKGVCAMTGPAAQVLGACVLFFAGLAWATGRREFLGGLASAFAAPVWSRLWVSRATISAAPHLRALLSASAGFALLIAGMLVSLYREKLLRWLEPAAGSRGQRRQTAAAVTGNDVPPC